ncbi:MAG: hypothetical protein ACMZ64_11670 [Oleiphilus sp.]
MKAPFETIPMSSLSIQIKMSEEALLTHAINGDLRLYMTLTNIESVERYDFDDDHGCFVFLGHEPVISDVTLPVNAALCRKIYLKGYAVSKIFVSHSGLDKVVLEEDVSIKPDILFAKLPELNPNHSPNGVLKANPHGNSLRVLPRNDEIYEVANRLIEDNPKAFSFKSSHREGSYKINGRLLADYMYDNQLKLFGESNFISVEFSTFHERIITRDGLKKKKLPSKVKKTDKK